MSFVPVIPSPGIAGWRFLQRTYDRQFEAFSSSNTLKRETDHFEKAIRDISSAEELVSDHRLLKVALGAFGLQDDLGNRFFIKKILEDGTADPEALANKMPDPRYKKLSSAFGFGPGQVAKTNEPSAMQSVISAYKEQSFEVSIGAVDEAIRISLFAERELTELAARNVTEDARWYSMLGLPPLREMFETAVGLPKGVGRLGIDKQKTIFSDKVSAALKIDSLKSFESQDTRLKLTNLYLARTQIQASNNSASSFSTALFLLSAGSR